MKIELDLRLNAEPDSNDVKIQVVNVAWIRIPWLSILLFFALALSGFSPRTSTFPSA